MNALYELSIIKEKVEPKVFRVLFKSKPSRDHEQQDLRDARTNDKHPLIHPHVTAAELLMWRKAWECPPERKQKRTDKRTMLLAAITVSGELFDFDKFGDHAGCVKLDEVYECLTRLQELVSELDANDTKFRILSNRDYLENGYKGRAYSRVTAMALQRMGVPFRIIIEPQDWDDYEAFFDPSLLIVAPFSNHGDGPGRARNLAWDIAIKEGHTAHWVMDDNIKDFYRLNENARIRFADGGCFRVMEDFFDRCENLYIAGPQYRFFCAPRSGYSPFVLNTRIYSCLLIRNDCKYRWRGRYNEDTDLSLRVLKDGDCTLQWNEFLQEKMATQALSGGNTAEFYHTEHLTGEDDPELGKYHANGTWNKSIMLEKMHPDVARRTRSSPFLTVTVGDEAERHFGVGKHDGGTEKKQPPPQMDCRVIAPSVDPFGLAERKTRQANRRFPAWVVLMTALKGRSL